MNRLGDSDEMIRICLNLLDVFDTIFKLILAYLLSQQELMYLVQVFVPGFLRNNLNDTL